MEPALLIRGARQLLTVRGPAGPRRGPSLGDVGLIPDGAILIRDGIIQAVGPSRQVQSLSAARNCEEIDASGKVVMPAFVDLGTSLVHAHPATRSLERLLRNFDNPDSEAFREVLQDGGHALAALSAHTLKRRANLIARGMLHHGTGTAESHAGYPLEGSSAMKVLRVQNECGKPLKIHSSLRLQLAPGDDPVPWATHVCEELMPAVRRRRLAAVINLKYDRNSLPAPIAMKVFSVAFRLGFSIWVDSDFFALSSAVPLAVRAGAVAVGHLRRVTPDEIDVLAASPTIAVLRPGGLLQTGMAYSEPGRELIDAGVSPALASGYHPELSPGYNMQLILLLACRFYRLRPEEAICAATINGAHALGVEASVGSLERGKQADIVVLNVSDYREAAYYAGINIVDKMIKQGQVVYDSRDASRDDGE